MQDSNDFEQPIPTDDFRHDFSKNPLAGKQPIVYAAGKLDQVAAKMYFEGKIPNDDLLCSFRYYDSVAKEKVHLEKFTAFVLGIYYGSFSNGKERGEINYQSNLVKDTRTDVLHSFYFMPKGDSYEIRTLALGNYSQDIKPAIEKEGRGSSYTKVAVAYIQELGEVRAIHLSTTAEAGFIKAIAQSQGQPEHKASLYRIGELASEIWALRFEGQYEPVVFSPKGAKNVGLTVPADKTAKAIFFQPVLKAGVIRQTSEKWRDTYEKMAELQIEFSDYIESEQSYYRERLNKKAGVQDTAPQQTAAARPTPVSTDPNFPTQEVWRDYENAQPDHEQPLPF